MTTRYFEYAVSQGEGTLITHAVFEGVDFSGWCGVIGLLCVVEQITKKRYHEFISIHGSEVAI